MAGKGDTPRKVNKKKYDENYDRIFRKPLETEEETIVSGLEKEVGLSLPGILQFLRENPKLDT